MPSDGRGRIAPHETGSDRTDLDRSGPVAGILLAGGTSSRMGAGTNKLLLDLGGEPLIRRSVRRAVASGLSPVIVVLGHEAERVREALSGLPCRTTVNPDFATGITTSVRAGLDAVPDDASAAAVMLADMPHVTPEMIDGLIERYRASTAPLVISDYEGVNAPPMLYDRSLFPELAAMNDGRCGKQVVKRHRHEAEVVRQPPAALTDVDLPEDYEQVAARLDAPIVEAAAPTDTSERSE